MSTPDYIGVVFDSSGLPISTHCADTLADCASLVEEWVQGSTKSDDVDVFAFYKKLNHPPMRSV